MELEVERRAVGVAIVRPRGRLDSASAGALRTALTHAVAAGHRRLVVDLSAVGCIDRSGWGALVNGLNTARQAAGDLRIACPNRNVTVSLTLTSLHRVLPPEPTVAAALARYAAAGYVTRDPAVV